MPSFDFMNTLTNNEIRITNKLINSLTKLAYECLSVALASDWTAGKGSDRHRILNATDCDLSVFGF